MDCCLDGLLCFHNLSYSLLQGWEILMHGVVMQQHEMLMSPMVASTLEYPPTTRPCLQDVLMTWLQMT